MIDILLNLLNAHHYPYPAFYEICDARRYQAIDRHTPARIIQFNTGLVSIHHLIQSSKALLSGAIMPVGSDTVRVLCVKCLLFKHIIDGTQALGDDFIFEPFCNEWGSGGGGGDDDWRR